MCTNKYTLDLVTLMNKGEIDDMKSINNFVEIIYETPSGWQRDCYNRSELLKVLQKEWNETNTFWNDGEARNRIKAVYKLPLSGEFLTEDAVRLLSLPYFTQFIKVTCNNYKIGSYFFQSSIHGAEHKVCKLEPLIEINNSREEQVLENVNLQDEGILSIQLREIPAEIYEQSEEITEEEQELINQEKTESDRIRVEQERNGDVPPETIVERMERHELARERVFSRLFSQREYKSENFPLVTHVFQRDRIVVYNNVMNNISLEQWLQTNNFSPDIYDKLKSHIGNLSELKNVTDEQLISYGLAEEDANMLLSTYNYTLIDIDDIFNNCYTVRETVTMPNRYYERYCFDSAKTAEDIFFKTPYKRVEIRGFHHVVNNSIHAAETKLYSDEQILFKITADPLFYTFGLFLMDDSYDCYIVNKNGNLTASRIASLSNKNGPHPVNQYTIEQFIRTCALVYLILLDVETTDEIISLVKLLSMGLSYTNMLDIYEQYIAHLFNNTDADKTSWGPRLKTVYNNIVNMFKNDRIHNMIGQFNDNYHLVTKNMFLVLLLKYVRYEEITQGENAILNLVNKAFGGEYKDVNGYDPIHMILFNKYLSSEQMIEIITMLHDSFNVSFDNDINYYTTLIKKSSFEHYLPLANLFFDNNLDPTIDVNNISILHHAVLQGDNAVDLVDWLIKKGADVNRVGRTGDIIANPLEMVYYLYQNDLLSESKKVIRLLKNAGATIERTPYETLVKDDEGGISQINYNIVYMILNMRSREEYDFFSNYISFMDDINITLKGYYNILTAFCISAFYGSDEGTHEDLENFLTILESKQFDFSQVDNNGYTPAMFAIMNNFDPATILQILNKDASVVSIHSLKNESILQKCIEFGDDNLEIVKKIVQANIDEVFKYFTITTPSNTTEQSHAIKYSHELSVNQNISTEIYNYLSRCNDMNDFYLNITQNKIHINSQEFHNLFFADKTPETLKRLLSVDIFQSNILIIAIKANINHKFTDDNDFELFRKLVDLYLFEGGDINFMDQLQFSVLSWVITNKYPLRIIQYLMSKGSNPDIPGSISALVLADRTNETFNYQDVIEYLEGQGATRFTESVDEDEEYEDEDFEETYFRHREESEEEEEDEESEDEEEPSVRRNLFGFKKLEKIENLNRIKKYY